MEHESNKDDFLSEENSEDLAELRRRTELRKQGLSKTYSWGEAKKLILNPQNETTELSDKDVKWLEEQSEQRRNGLIELSTWQDVRSKIVFKKLKNY